MKISSINNFDLIRLFAASQVAVSHIASHLNYESFLLGWLSMFPGVPIFFFVSGFLIYGSYEKSVAYGSPLINFFTKRFLRLYPALWFCLLLTIISLFASGYLSLGNLKLMEFLIWFFTSSTFFQFYNPDFLRGYGVGAINGSLWTIAVELQFYILTPILFILLRKKFLLVSVVVLLLVIFNGLNTHFNPSVSIFQKLVKVSFLPWLYMFTLGALAYKNQKILEWVSKIPLLALAVIYVVVYLFTREFGWGNGINIVGYLSLSILIMKLAITCPSLSDRILKRNDISYGVYILHMPIVNFMLFKGYEGGGAFFIALTLTIVFSLVSWFLIERPSLRMKKNQLRKN